MGLGRVLVVDDERPLARIVGSYLEREGFDVSVAHDGPSAVTAARQDMPILVADWQKKLDELIASKKLPKTATPLDFEIGRPLADVTVLDAAAL